MKIALFSDIHANAVALRAVLDFLDKNHPVDQFWCMGDLIGYGPEPVETVEIARSRLDFWVAGNHEESWFSIFNMDNVGKIDHSKSVVRLVEELRPKLMGRPPAIETWVLHLKALRAAPVALNWLASELKRPECEGPQVKKVEGLTLIPIHATFSNPTGGYPCPWESESALLHLFQANEGLMQHKENGIVEHINNGLAERIRIAQAILKSESPYLVIFGHTHVQGIYIYKDGRAQGALPPGYDIPVSIGDNPMAINPGSLGHPSDLDPRAAFAILDTTKRQVTFYRVPYDLNLVRDKLFMHNYPDSMWEEIENSTLRERDIKKLGSFHQQLKKLAVSPGG